MFRRTLFIFMLVTLVTAPVYRARAAAKVNPVPAEPKRKTQSLTVRLKVADGTPLDRLRGVHKAGNRSETGAVALTYQSIPNVRFQEFHEFARNEGKIEVERARGLAVFAEAHHCERRETHIVHRLLQATFESASLDGVPEVTLVLKPVATTTLDLLDGDTDPLVRLCEGEEGTLLVEEPALEIKPADDEGLQFRTSRSERMPRTLSVLPDTADRAK